VLRRLAALVPSALGVSLLIFLLMHLIPGTVVDQMIGTEARVGEEARQAMRAFFGLDRPLHVQYLGWVGGVLHGDFGLSWRSGLPVGKMILDRLGVTLELSSAALLVALLVAGGVDKVPDLSSLVDARLGPLRIGATGRRLVLAGGVSRLLEIAPGEWLHRSDALRW
jgi:peptide/nickel transport system permease protein